MSGEQSLRRFRAGIVLVGLAWCGHLAIPVNHWDARLAVIGCGLAPYLLLATLSFYVLRLAVLVPAGVIVLALDVLAWRAARSSSSSTAPVAIVLAWLFSVMVVVPTTLAVGWLTRRPWARRR